MKDKTLRADFEANAEKLGIPILRYKNGHYWHGATLAAWKAWKAAAHRYAPDKVACQAECERLRGVIRNCFCYDPDAIDDDCDVIGMHLKIMPQVIRDTIIDVLTERKNQWIVPANPREPSSTDSKSDAGGSTP